MILDTLKLSVKVTRPSIYTFLAIVLGMTDTLVFQPNSIYISPRK